MRVHPITFVTALYLVREVDPCHHGMARRQVADGGTAFNMVGSCENIEQAVADSQQWEVIQLGGWARG
jgi:hypothetical protein